MQIPPADILATAFRRASEDVDRPILENSEASRRIRFVCRCQENRAGVRLLMACLLAKIHEPEVDIRKPYTEIGDDDSYSGRTYDERYIRPFITEHNLPCNPTTAFLTPAFRNRNIVLTPDADLVGRPPELYQNVLQLLTDINTFTVSAQDALAEVVRCLLVLRDERQRQTEELLEQLGTCRDGVPLAAENIVTLIQQHLNCPRASRLPVLVVAAAYRAAEAHLGEQILPLHSHTAADSQTGALGDVEITMIDDDNIVTGYEMKAQRVTIVDIDNALAKVIERGQGIDNYIIITTDPIEQSVRDYAASMYERTSGIEFVVLDCISFLRHFLHLFYRLRMQFLDAYQDFLIAEPESAVRQELKDAFLILRRAAQSGG